MPKQGLVINFASTVFLTSSTLALLHAASGTAPQQAKMAFTLEGLSLMLAMQEGGQGSARGSQVWLDGIHCTWHLG